MARALMTGMFGGALVTGVAIGAFFAAGGAGSSTRTVTVVEQAPVAAARVAGRSHALAAHEVYEQDAPGVVLVRASGVKEAQSAAEIITHESERQGPATGSGFELDAQGMILTNWHVVDGAGKITVSLGASAKPIEARVVGKDPSDDLAVLQIPTDHVTLHPLALGDSNTVQVGEPVIAIGNPFGYARSLTTGVISALGRQILAPNGARIDGALQTDAPVNPGNSGGPLLDSEGRVIGITSEIVTASSRGGSVGIAFAIPIDTAKKELPALEKATR